MNQCAFRHSARNLPLNDSMKALSVGSRSGEVERDAALISPEVEVAGDKLCALIDPDCFRETDLTADLFEYLHNVRAAEV
jgi:hypothetical protein